MIYVLYALIVAVVVLGIALTYSIVMNVRFAKMIFSIEDQIEESLDILDEQYQAISYVTTIPVMSDEPVIRDVLERIRNSRDALLLIANKLTNFESEKQTNVQ